MQNAQEKRFQDRWRAGEFAGKGKAAQRPGRSWTPAQREAAHRRKTAAASAKAATA